MPDFDDVFYGVFYACKVWAVCLALLLAGTLVCG